MKDIKIDLSTEELTAKIRERSSIYSSMQIGSNNILATVENHASQYGKDTLGNNILRKVDIIDAFVSSHSDRLVLDLEVK